MKAIFPNKNLLDWYDRVKRPMPWRQTKDPYLTWVSEIILQQTRVEQGMPYYERFTTHFPTVHHLAEASQDEVLKLWEGLGYYSRARNMHSTAKYISIDLAGEFPRNHKELLGLKGVGPYTAAAIGSIAFGNETAAVDGNVIRVVSRFFGIEEAVDSTVVKKEIDQLAQSVLDENLPGEHNQAMMELGATCCTPKNPICAECPLKVSCIAFRQDLQYQIPTKLKKTKLRNRYFYFVVRRHIDQVAIEKRSAGDIWEGLYQFPLVEAAEELSTSDMIAKLNLDEEDEVVSITDNFKHVLSHQRIYAKFVKVKIAGIGKPFGQSVELTKLMALPMPRLILRYLEKYPLVDIAEV